MGHIFCLELLTMPHSATAREHRALDCEAPMHACAMRKKERNNIYSPSERPSSSPSPLPTQRHTPPPIDQPTESGGGGGGVARVAPNTTMEEEMSSFATLLFKCCSVRLSQ